MKTRDLHWFDLTGRAVTRRDFVRITRDAAALMALGSLPACGQGRTVSLRSRPFPAGVASGDPSSDGAVLWTRLSAEGLREIGSSDEAVSVGWEVAADDAFGDVVRDGSSLALPELGHSVHVEVEGLEPDRPYWFRFLLGDDASPIGRTRTMPTPGVASRRLRFAVASCQNFEHGFFTAYQHMSNEDLDLVFHLGDYIYERRFDGPLVREHEADEVTTLDGYRARYSLYRSDPDLQRAHAAFPWIVTPDDHEVDNNWAGDAAEDDQSSAELLLRRVAAFQAYYEFMPLRRTSMPDGPGIRLFRRLRWGGLADLHVLDGRQYRSDQACGDRNQRYCPQAFDPGRTMLGPEQEAWLFDGLAGSDARWNVLANQVMLARVEGVLEGQPAVSMDRWDGYVEAQARLIRFLSEERPNNPVVITGDIHSHWAADVKADFDDPASPVVASEVVGTSISSGGDGQDQRPRTAATLERNPHIHFFNGQRGYVRCTLTPGRLTADYRVLPYVGEPGAPVSTRATFVVENGRPGLQTA